MERSGMLWQGKFESSIYCSIRVRMTDQNTSEGEYGMWQWDQSGRVSICVLFTIICRRFNMVGEQQYSEQDMVDGRVSGSGVGYGQLEGNGYGGRWVGGSKQRDGWWLGVVWLSGAG